MRRLWAHIIIAAAAFVAVIAAFPSLIKGITTTGENDTRRQFTFQLTQREKDENGQPGKELNGESANEIARIMEQRLLSYGITSYDISTSGATGKEKSESDIVKVSFKADNDQQYKQITNYLSFSGSFALMNNQDVVIPAKDFRNGNAYLKNAVVNEYPTVILPIVTTSNEWEPLLQGAKDNPVTPESSDDTEQAQVGRVWLIFNYVEGDTYKILNGINKLSEKTLLTFDFNLEDEVPYSSFYYDSNKNSIAKTVGYSDTNGNGYADPNEVKNAYNEASYLLNLFNASSLDYEVECIAGFDDTAVWLEPTVEKILNQGKIVWNATLTACVAGLVIISLLLAVFYRLGALSAVTATTVVAFFSFLLMVRSGLVYSGIALAGIVLVAIISLVSNIIYLNKLKEDAYRGHTLKKANTEASKKSLLPIIDINVVGIIIGVMTYLLGGSSLHAFGAIVGLGSFISLLVNTLGLKGLMWLATNTTGLIGKYEWFGIDSKNVPNHMAEEKQRYFGAYAEKDFTNKKKPAFIGFGAAFVLSLVGIIVASSLLGGGLLKPQASKTIANELYVSNKIVVESTDSKSDLDETSLQKEILEYIEIDNGKKDEQGQVVFEKLTTIANLDNYKKFTVTDYETKEGIEQPIEYRTTYFVVSLKQSLDLVNTQSRIVGKTAVQSLETTLENFYSERSLFISSVSNSIEYKKTTTVVPTSYTDWTKVVLSTSIAIAILTLYFMLRYRLTRGLSTLVMSFGSGAITLGLLTLLSAIGLSIPSEAFIAIPVVVFLSYVFALFFMNREREVTLDDKTRDVSIEHRAENANKAMGMAYTPILASAVIGIYLLINFFGFGVAISSYSYLIAILGGIIALVMVTFFEVPFVNLLTKAFSKIHINIKPRERSKKKAQVKKSAEPEEAIFIGIND